MDRIQCFFLEPSDQAEITLRRFTFTGPGVDCPKQSYGHDASAVIGIEPYALRLALQDVDGEYTYGDRQDARWPLNCSACGYAFQPADEWQRGSTRLYKRSDTGALVTIRAAPVGAMWFADWMQQGATAPLYRGPDGHCLVLKTPDGDWCMDGPASNGDPAKPGWVRSGSPPLVVAMPSISQPKYHGWLGGPAHNEPGWLVRC